jgi:hypothetical protein
MGLDMYLHKRPLDELENKEAYKEVAYWRKHYSLQDFIHYNIHQIENCVEFELTKSDLERMLSWVSVELEMAELDYDYQALINGDEQPIYSTESLSWNDYQNLKTVEQLSTVLRETNFEKEAIFYWAWW